MAKSHGHGAAFRSVLRLFALFGHPVRVVIFQRLARVPMTASELALGLPISRTAVVQHLKQLETARLVNASPDGRKRIYSIRPEGLVPLDRWLRQYLGEAAPAGHRTKVLSRSR
jgi:DNA-binding transcriptional ArsR family regulator